MTRAALVALVGARIAAAAPTMTLADGAREVRVDLGTLSQRDAVIADRTDGGKQKRVTGAALDEVLARLPAPPGSDTLAVRCDDGWLSLLPHASLGRGGLLALREGGAPLAAPRGPIFLVWTGPGGDPILDESGWTWGVSRLEWVRAADFARPLEVTGGGAAAERGRDLFARHCQHCHAVRGAGGMVGWDLARPSVLSYRSAAYVRSYVLDPRRRNPGGHMPPFRGTLRPVELDALLAYLAALDQRRAPTVRTTR